MNIVKEVLNEWKRKNNKIAGIKRYRDFKNCDLRTAKIFCDELQLNNYIRFSSNNYYYITSHGQRYIREQENKFIKNPWGIKPKIYKYLINENYMHLTYNKFYKYVKTVSNAVFFVEDCGVFYDLEVKSVEDLKEKISLL